MLPRQPRYNGLGDLPALRILSARSDSDPHSALLLSLIEHHRDTVRL